MGSTATKYSSHLDLDTTAADSMATAEEDNEHSRRSRNPSNDDDIESSSSSSSSSKPTTTIMNGNANDDDDDDDKKKKRRKNTNNNTMMIKYGSLLLLIGQMVGLVLLMRYSKTHGERYLDSTAVFVMEVMKFVLCLSVIYYRSNFSLMAVYDEIYVHVYGSPMDMMKLCIPSFLYVVQNNLLYLALTNLDAATYQILYQLKILTTATFSATLLGRRFSSTKWIALVILTVGVAIVQISGSSDHHRNTAEGGGPEEDDKNRAVGLVAVLCAACTSGFAGVYFERILKGSDVTLWIRNIQMGIPSVLIALLTVYVEDYSEVRNKGFFVGYNAIVLLVITTQAVGGLIVAVVVKYADNVLKTFAASFSIVLSCIISAIIFDFRPNLIFICGASLVILSTVLYSKPDNNSSTYSWSVPIKRSSTREQRVGVRKSSLVM